MAKITFEQSFVGMSQVWEAKAEVHSNFCVRVVMNSTSKCTIGLSSVENGEPAIKYINESVRIVDEDFDARVFPKYLTIRCWAEPKNGEIIEAE